MEPAAVVAAVDGAWPMPASTYVKVGLFPGAAARRIASARCPRCARRTKIVGVMFADEGADQALLPLMAESGFAGAMLDTAHKRHGHLLDHARHSGAGQISSMPARAHGLLAGLAGSLEPPDIPRLLLLAPDILGFRGALCAGQDRTARIDPAAIDVRSAR